MKNWGRAMNGVNHSSTLEAGNGSHKQKQNKTDTDIIFVCFRAAQRMLNNVSETRLWLSKFSSAST